MGAGVHCTGSSLRMGTARDSASSLVTGKFGIETRERAATDLLTRFHEALIV